MGFPPILQTFLSFRFVDVQTQLLMLDDLVVAFAGLPRLKINPQLLQNPSYMNFL